MHNFIKPDSQVWPGRQMAELD